MLYGRLDGDGILHTISYRPLTYSDDVPLKEMPTEMGEFRYDAEKQLAIFIPSVPSKMPLIITEMARAAAERLGLVEEETKLAVDIEILKKDLLK